MRFTAGLISDNNLPGIKTCFSIIDMLLFIIFVNILSSMLFSIFILFF